MIIRGGVTTAGAYLLWSCTLVMARGARLMLLAAVLLLPTQSVFAQSYPVKPVRIIVPFAPGGGTDIIARVVAPRLAERFGQQVLVENRPGAATIVGAEYVARAQPDGYTLLLALTGTLAINPALYAKLPYHPLSSFAPVALIATSPNILVVHPSLPVKSVAELIRLAKGNPGKLNYASSGTGGAPHLAGELLKKLARIELVQVPYKGAGPALTDVLGGHVSIMFSALPPVLPAVRAGRLRALAVTASKRSRLVADLPTMAESGVPEFEVTTWFGMLAPAATDRKIIENLSGEVRSLVADETLVRVFAEQGLEAHASSSAEFAAYIKSEINRWGKIVREAGIRLE